MDDLFGDLVSVRSTAAAAAAAAAEAAKANGTTGAEASGGSVSSARAEEPPSVTVAISRAEYEQILGASVQSAVDSAFAKFAKSLRTVLEDMNKRLEAQEKAQEQIHVELQDLLRAQGEALVRQDHNSNTRFTSLDLAIREVDRGVQSLRDKQELHEAQALLARFSGDSSTSGAAGAAAEKKGATAAEQPAAAAVPAAAAPAAPAPAPAPAPALAAASPAVASAPAPTAAPAPALPALATAPFPVMPHQMHQPQQQHQQLLSPGMHAAPASAPAGMYQQPGYQQQQQAPAPHLLHQQPQGPEQQYGALPSAQQGYPYRGPDGGLPSMPPSQVSGAEQYPLMLPQQQHQQQPQQQQHMPPSYAPPHFQQPSPMQMQQQPQQQQQPMQGPMPPSMVAPMSGMPPSSSSMYPVARMPSYPASVPPQRSPSYQEPMPTPSQGGPPPQSKTSSRAVPLEQIISDITNMGFQRHQVMQLVNNMQKNGQAVDLNVIIDKLTRGDYR